MCEEGIKELLGITGVLVMINNWELNTKKYINNMAKMACRNGTSVDVLNERTIREYGREK